MQRRCLQKQKQKRPHGEIGQGGTATRTFDSDWNELVNLLGEGGDPAVQDFFLDESVEMTTKGEATTELEGMATKLKELQDQLVALTIENEALKAQPAESAVSETVQLLRQQLEEERAARISEAPAVGGQGWTSGRIPRALARLRRRNTAAVAAANAAATAAASQSAEGAAASSYSNDAAENDADADADDEHDEASSSEAVVAEGVCDEGLLCRMKNLAVAGLLSLLEDMQVPTEAERQAAAADDQLSARRLKVNCTRFGRSTQPIFACIDGFVRVIRWRSPSYTVLVMLVYYFALLNNYLLPMILLMCIVRLLLNYLKYRLGWDMNFNFLAEYEDSDSEDAAGGSEKERTVGTQVNFVVHVAKKVQNLTGKLADNLEKLKNLFTWRSQNHTQLLLNALIVAFVFSLLVPTTTYLFYCAFYLGIKFFIIDAIFAKYPRLRRKYDSVDRIWRTLPTDQQVGYHQTNKDVEKYILPYTEEDQICTPESRPENRSPLCSDDEEFCQIFALPNLECPLTRWKGGKRCAIILKEADKALPDSLKHGKLFLTRSFLCFERGKDRGKAKKRNIVIPLTTIQWIKKTKPFAWLPGGGMAIEVQIRGMEKAITFGAIIGRDELFDSLMETGRRVSLPWAAAGSPAAPGSGGGSSDAAVSVEAAAVAAEEQVTLDLDLVQSVSQALLSDSDSDD